MPKIQPKQIDGLGVAIARIQDFRLSGVTATPIMTADSTTLSTVFLCQYKGNSIALYNGTLWNLYAPASEPSLAVTGRTTNLPFDVFAFDSGGVVTLEFTDWSSATARATALVRQDGVWVRSGATTRRYLGTIRPRSATTFHWVRNATDTPAQFDLWNNDNRVSQSFMNITATDTWNYTIATWRQAQGSTNYQTDVVVGLQEESISITLNALSRNNNILASVPSQVGIGFDSTTAFTGTAASSTTSANQDAEALAVLHHQPTIGRHFYAWLEISDVGGTTSWVGDNGGLRIQTGLTGSWTC